MVVITSTLNAFVAPANIAVTINVERSAAQLAGDGVWFTCDVSNMTRGAGAGTYDPRLHKLHYFWEFYVGDATPRTFGSFLNIPTAWNNKRVSYVPKPSHIYDEPGTYTVGVTVVDEETGEIGTGEATVVVADPNTYYTAAQTIVVASDSDYTGAPSHDVGNRYTTIEAGLSAMQSLTGEGRCVIKTGTSYTPSSMNSLYIGTNFANFRIETWGAGAKPILNMGPNTQRIGLADFMTKDITIRGLRLVGGWNPQTESGNRASLIYFYSGQSSKWSLSNIEIADGGAGVTILGAATNYNQNSRYCLSSVHVDGWQSYGLYVDAGHSAGTSTDANVYVGVNGCTIAHDPLALAGGSGDLGAAYNSQECFRQVNWAKVTFDACDFFTKAGWFVVNDKPSVGACIRGNASEKDGQELYVSRTVMEGGVNVLSIRPSEGNFLIDTCLMVGSIDTSNMFEMMAGGTTVRNVMAVRPDSVPHGNGFAFFTKDGTITAADGAEGLNLYNDSFVNLQSSGSWNFDNSGYLTTDYSVYVNANNFFYGPNFGTAHQPDGAATGATTTGFTPRYSGWRWGFEYFSFTVPSTANGATFDILYSQITLQEGGNPTQTTFGSGLNSVNNIWEDGAETTFAFLSDRVRITNNTGSTISGSYKIRLDRHNGTLPAQDTSKATPSGLFTKWTPTGAALDAAVSQPIAIRDFDLVTRGSPADKGALEVAYSGPTEWTFVGSENAGGGTYSTGQTHTPALPTGWQADDLAILHVTFDPVNQTPPTVPAGWQTAIDQQRNTGTASTNDANGMLFRRILQAGDTAPTLTQNGGNYFRVNLAVIRGADTSAPIEAVANAQEITQSVINDFAGVTTLGPERMIFYLESGGDDAAHTSFVDADLVSVTQAYHFASASGNDHFASLHYGIKTAAGAVGTNATHTITSAIGDTVMWTVAVKPAWTS